MSEAAERYVKNCAHPKVKGGARALLTAIAQLIPEGQTTTQPIVIGDLAVKAQMVDRTARTWRDVLETHGLIKVHEGGRGNVARYEILDVAGERPLTAAPLPLLGRVKPPRTIKQRSTSATSADLFTEEPAYVGNFCRRWIVNVGNFYRRFVSRTIKQRSTSASFADVRVDRTKEQRSTSATFADVPAPSSRYVRTEVVEEEAPRAREPADAFLDWFEQTYRTAHHGATCTVDRVRDGAFVRELLARPRTDVAHLQAMTQLLWTLTTDGSGKSDRWWIAEKVTVRNVFVLHRKADFLDQEIRRREADAAVARELENLRDDVVRRIGPDWRKSG